MPHTASRYQQDLGFPDGRIFLPFNRALNFGANAGTATQNAVGDNSQNWVASQAAKLDFCLNSGLLLKTGFGEDLQEQFGGSGIAGSAGPQGRPPFTAAQLAAVRSAFKLKGIKITALRFIYTIGGAALTAHTCRIDQVVHANNVANAITAILASGANGLATAVQTNPYVTAVTLASPIYITTDSAEWWLEWVATTQGSGTLRFYGVELVVEYNFN